MPQVKSSFPKYELLFYYYKLKVLAKFFPNKKIISAKIFSFNISALNYSNLFYLFIEIFLTEEYKFETNNLHPKIIDCGANIGMASLYFKYLYPNSKVIAFEPNPEAFYYLKKNIDNNKLDVEIHNMALGLKNEKISFFYNQDSLFIGSMIESRGGQTKIDVEVVKLSSFLNTNTFNLVKIDVEGYENFIIEDLKAENAIINSEMYILEYHNNIENHKNNIVNIIDTFEKNNFTYTLGSEHPAQSFFQDINIRLYKNKN